MSNDDQSSAGGQTQHERPELGTLTPEREMYRQAEIELIKRYYVSRFELLEHYRARAKTAFTISTGVAGVLGFGALASGLFDDFSGEVQLTVGLVSAAFVAWIAAAVLSLRATSWSVDPRKKEQDQAGEESDDSDVLLERISFRRRLQPKIKAEERELRTRLRHAVVAISIALVLTLFAIGSSLAFNDPGDFDPAQVVLTADGEQALEEICQLEFSPIRLEVDSNTIDDEWVLARFPAGTCQREEVETRIQNEDIDGIIWLD